MKIAITLLTCGRLDYTRRTLESLRQHNPTLAGDFILLHGDDVSTPAERLESIDLAEAAGFHSAVVPKRQAGIAKMTEDLFAEAAKRGCDAVLNLQNDWVSKRPIPLDEVCEIFRDETVYCLRLYGAYKSDTGRCGIHHSGRSPLKVVEWSSYRVPGYDFGDIHWGHPPAVTRIQYATMLTKDAHSESTSRMRSGDIHRFTVRPVENIFSHIGRERTPGFKS